MSARTEGPPRADGPAKFSGPARMYVPGDSDFGKLPDVYADGGVVRDLSLHPFRVPHALIEIRAIRSPLPLRWMRRLGSLRRTESRRGGFTLVEVMAALLILATGMTALQGLGVRASRQVARADREGRYAALAVAEVERAMAAVARGAEPTGGRTVVGEATVERRVSRADAAGRALYTIGVTVKAQASPVPVLPVEVVARALR